jgi:hypothetical protein
METSNTLPFFDLLLKKLGSGLITNVYRKPMHAGRYSHSNLTILIAWKEKLSTVKSTEPKPYAKNVKISAEKITLQNGIPCLMYTSNTTFTPISNQGEITVLLQVEYTTVPWLCLMSGVYLRNLGVLESASVSGPSSEPKAGSGDLWWQTGREVQQTRLCLQYPTWMWQMLYWRNR